MTFRLLSLLPLLLPVAAGISDSGTEEAMERTLHRLRDRAAGSVVAIEVLRREGAGEDRNGAPSGDREGGTPAVEIYARPRGAVTGTIIDEDGWILTSRFNVSGQVVSLTVILPDGRRERAELKGTDEVRDLALLKIPVGNLPVLSRAASFRSGDAVAVLGRSPDPRVTTICAGIISAIDRHEGKAVQTDALLNFGNVGGPLLKLDGTLIGVTCRINTSNPWGQSSGVGFAAPMKEIDAVLERLKGGERIKSLPPGWLGVFPDPARPPGREGVRVARLVPGGPAAEAGLRAGDVIVEVDGTPVMDLVDFALLLRSFKAGTSLTLTVLRKKGEEAERLSIEIRLKEAPE